MSSREANIDNLNNTIAALGEDAESLHELIARSAEELKGATDAGNRAADNAAQLIEVLAPLTELLGAQHRDSAAMLDEAKKAADEQRASTVEQVEFLKTTVGETLESVAATTEDARTELKQTVESSFGELGKTQDEAFEELKAKTLKEHERTRDELQTDILGFKNATSARLDALEAGIAKVESANKELEGKVAESAGIVTKELEGKVAESASLVTKKLLVPIYAAIGVGIIDLICLVMLLVR